MAVEKPIILTLQIDERSQLFFNEMRKRYFPPAINHLLAHLTLFHKLPRAEEKHIVEAIAGEATAREPFRMMASAPMKLGRGVAYKIASDELMAMRGRLAVAFKPWLTSQDAQGFRPHITIQNKVSPAEAAGLHSHLSRDFEPFSVTAEGIQLWLYEGGPWRPYGAIAFGGG